VLLKKTGKTLFDVCSSFRAHVLSAMPLALRTSSYAKAIPLITQLRYYKHQKEKTSAFQA
jgi:hypothetical protein